WCPQRDILLLGKARDRHQTEVLLVVEAIGLARIVLRGTILMERIPLFPPFVLQLKNQPAHDKAIESLRRKLEIELIPEAGIELGLHRLVFPVHAMIVRVRTKLPDEHGLSRDGAPHRKNV